MVGMKMSIFQLLTSLSSIKTQGRPHVPHPNSKLPGKAVLIIHLQAPMSCGEYIIPLMRSLMRRATLEAPLFPRHLHPTMKTGPLSIRCQTLMVVQPLDCSPRILGHMILHSTDEASRESDPLDDMGSGCIYLPDLRTGKRLTRKPLKYCSPFKYGIMSRPPPNVDASMGLLEHLCDDDSFRSTPVIQIGSTHLTGDMIAQSFAEGSFPHPKFITAYVSCLRYDDFMIRPECHGYRIFLDADLSAILNVEWTKRDSSHFAAVTAINCCLPLTDLKKTKMILLPVLHKHLWSVYCVNFEQTRIDVLDSLYPTHDCDNLYKHHSEIGKKIMHRLSDALTDAAPLKFKTFKNWRHVPIKVPAQRTHPNLRSLP